MKFRKRPVVIEAEQFFQDQYDATGYLPPGACDDPDTGTHYYCVHVHTLEGIYPLHHLDWIICGVQGEYYPCRDDIFEATYEQVDQ